MCENRSFVSQRHFKTNSEKHDGISVAGLVDEIVDVYSLQVA
jgi:hypothetical protein